MVEVLSVPQRPMECGHGPGGDVRLRREGEGMGSVGFYPAEEYHRQYYRRHPHAPYCRLVIEPKMRKFLQTFAPKLAGPR